MLLTLLRAQVFASFQTVIPTADGSTLTGEDTAGLLVQNIESNMGALGVRMRCNATTCEFTVPDAPQHTRVLMLAVLGNFLNHDLDAGDAVAHVRIDPATGLLRRVHTSWWTRVMLTDTLLVLAVIMLVKRSMEQQGPPKPA